MGRKASLLLGICALAATARAASAPGELPPGHAKPIIEAKCKQCHDLKKITKQHQDAQWWATTLDKMVERGMEIEPDEQQLVLKYLTTNFGVAGDAGGKKTAKH